MAYEYQDKAGLIYTLTQIKSKLDGYLAGYVVKETGKGLSTNDLTNAMVEAINSISSKADLASPALTGTPTAPTAAAGTSTTQIATTNFVAAAIAAALSDVTGLKFEKVNSFSDLPATGANGTIYLVPNSGIALDVYDEYYWAGTAYEKMGSTSVDLSGYVKTSDLVAITTSEIDAMFNDW